MDMVGKKTKNIAVEKDHLAKNVFWVYLFTYMAIPLAYLVKSLYARTFSLEEFGLIYAIMGLITLLTTFNDLGFAETLSYFATRFYQKRQYSKVYGALIFAFLMQGITAILLLIAFQFLSPYLAAHYFKTPLAIAALRWFLSYFLFLTLLNPMIQLFRATHHYSYYQASNFFRTLLIFILSMVILFVPALHNLSFIGFVWGFSYAVVFFAYVHIARKKFKEIFTAKPDLSFSLYKSMLSYALPLVITTYISILLFQTDVILLTYFHNTVVVGLYSVAMTVAAILGSLLTPFTSMVVPYTARLNLINKKRLLSFIRAFHDKALFLSIPLFLVLFMFADSLLFILFGAGYASMRIVAMILCFAFFLMFFFDFSNGILAGLGLVKQRMIIASIGAVFNLALATYLIPRYNTMGAALSFLLTTAFMLVCLFFIIRQKTGFILLTPLFFKILGLGLVLLLLLGSSHFLLATYVIGKSGLLLGLGLTAVCILISLYIYLFLGNRLGVVLFSEMKGFLKSNVPFLFRKWL